MECSAVAGKFNAKLSVGDVAPAWKDLPGVDDRRHSLADHKAKVVVLLFCANHCPVSAACEPRWKKFATEFRPQGVDVVAISVSRFESDRLDKMKERSRDAGDPYPYLIDESQEIGKKFGATTTPQVFVLVPSSSAKEPANEAKREWKVAYMGAFDDNSLDEKKIEEHYAREAVKSLLAGKTPAIRETKPKGCAIEYGPASK